MARYLADTNILLRFVDRAADEHALVKVAVATLLGRGDEVVLVPQTLYEFWATGTRPVRANGFGWDTPRARREVEGLLESFELLSDPPKLFDAWLELVTRHNVRGKQVHDARLVAAMYLHGLSHLLTLNGGDFKRYPEIEAVHPGEVQA